MKQEQFIRIRVKLMEQLRQGAEWSDEEILERIDLLVSETARENRLTVKQREEIRRELFYSVRKLDILQELLDDDRVTEIMVNGYQNIFVEREGKKSRWEKSFVSKEKLEQLKETASDYEGCSFSVSNLVPSKVNIDTAGISIKTEIEKLSRIERRVIDGIDYYLIPVNSSSIDDILLANKHSK